MCISKEVTILAFETSCDDTAAAIVHYDGKKFSVLSAIRSSQENTHRPYGGVVPELATRDHMRLLPEVAGRALTQAHVSLSQLDAIAATRGPGLAVALIVGHTFGKCLAASLDCPFLGVNHLHGHLISPFITCAADSWSEKKCLCLLVSGGHTMLVILEKSQRPKILGATRDDAVGEAFDKAARLLGLPYPGGPSISKAALQGDPSRFDFPRPMLNKVGLEFSFSGLKTALRIKIDELRHEGVALDTQLIADLSASFQKAIVETLVEKTRRALIASKAEILTLAGGVAANLELREALRTLSEKQGVDFIPTQLEHSTDNAVMIAAAAAWQYLQGHHSTLEEEIHPRAGEGDDWLTSSST